MIKVAGVVVVGAETARIIGIFLTVDNMKLNFIPNSMKRIQLVSPNGRMKCNGEIIESNGTAENLATTAKIYTCLSGTFPRSWP